MPAREKITVQIENNKTLYTSRIIKAAYGDLLSKVGRGDALVIERLSPDTGNKLLKLTSRIVMKFQLHNRSCQFVSKYLGESTKYPHIGLVTSYPVSVVIKERRSYERNTKKIPEFLHAVFKLGKDEKRTVTYELKIINRSANGVGLLVTRKDFEVLEMLKEGDRLPDLELYASTVVCKVIGVVRHKTKLDDPEYEGSYVLGIEIEDPLEEIDLT